MNAARGAFSGHHARAKLHLAIVKLKRALRSIYILNSSLFILYFLYSITPLFRLILIDVVFTVDVSGLMSLSKFYFDPVLLYGLERQTWSNFDFN